MKSMPVYWNQEWKDILFGDGNAYLDRIIAAGLTGPTWTMWKRIIFFTTNS